MRLTNECVEAFGCTSDQSVHAEWYKPTGAAVFRIASQCFVIHHPANILKEA